MKKLVLDTNVVVSGLLNPNGNEARVMSLFMEGKVGLCVSEPVLTEYREVLGRPHLRRLPQIEVSNVLGRLSTLPILRPAISITASPDPTDNRFLECAEAANADYLITGNKRHFPSKWKDTRVVNAREFLEILARP